MWQISGLERGRGSEIMANGDVVPGHNRQRNVPKLFSESKHSLRALAHAYFVTEVSGQPSSTIRHEAPRPFPIRSLLTQNVYGHDHPQEWFASVTREFLKQTAREG